MRDVWVDVVETFNDPSFNPKSNIFTYLHPNYEQSIDISYKAIEHVMKLTPDKAKVRFQKAAAQLNIVKTNWEASGNGDGGRIDPGNDEEGADGLDIGCTNDKKNYVDRKGFKPYLLYLWEYAEKNGILHCVLQRIDKNFAYDTEPPKTTATRDVLKRKREEEKIETKRRDDEFMNTVTMSMKATNHAITRSNIVYMESNILTLETELDAAEDKMEEMKEKEVKQARIDIQNKRIQRIKAKIAVKEKALETYIAESNTLGFGGGDGEE